MKRSTILFIILIVAGCATNTSTVKNISSKKHTITLKGYRLNKAFFSIDDNKNVPIGLNEQVKVNNLPIKVIEIEPVLAGFMINSQRVWLNLGQSTNINGKKILFDYVSSDHLILYVGEFACYLEFGKPKHSGNWDIEVTDCNVNEVWVLINKEEYEFDVNEPQKIAASR